MKKLKFLPTILMLVLCVGVLAIGIYAITPSKNTIDGTITVNPSNTEIDVQLYHTSVADNNKIGGLHTIRAGKTLDISCSALNYSMEGVNELANANATPKVVIFEITNKSDDQPLGAYFLDPAHPLATEGENAGKAQDENILTEPLLLDGVEKESKNPVEDILKATFEGYTEIPAGETETISITFELLKLWGEDVEVSFKGLNISLNVEPLQEGLIPIEYTEIGTSGQPITNALYKDNETLTRVKIADGVTGIGDEAFSGCTNLVEVLLPANSLEYIGVNAFANCDNLVFKTDGSNNKYLGGTDNDYLALISVSQTYGQATIMRTVEIIASNAIKDKLNITGIELPSTLRSISYYAFNTCGLTSIEIPASVTNLGKGSTTTMSVFPNCDSLSEVVFSSGVSTLDLRILNDISHETLTTFKFAAGYYAENIAITNEAVDRWFVGFPTDDSTGNDYFGNNFEAKGRCHPAGNYNIETTYYFDWQEA